MITQEAVRADIVAKLGFFPPFFEPALATPVILEELWRQTQVAYLNNPLPIIFKEKLAALLGRYCSVPYCLICHSASLRPLGLSATEVLALLEGAPPTIKELAASAAKLGQLPAAQWPQAGSSAEQAILDCSVAIFLHEDAAQCHENLRLVLGESRYNFLVLFVAYNRVCLTWAEAHPELSHEADLRSIQNLGAMLQDEPGLALFFANYGLRAQAQAGRRASWLTHENKRLIDKEHRLRVIAEEECSQKRALLDSVHEGIYGVDVAGKCTFINSAASHMLRHTSESLLGKNIVDLMTGRCTDGTEQAAWDRAAASRCIVTAQPHREPDMILKRYDGSEFAAELTAVPTLVQGQCTGAVVTFRDLTAVKLSQAEEDQERLLASRQHAILRDVFYQTPVPICMLEGAEQIFTLVNLPYMELTGHRKLLGKSVRRAFPELADMDIHQRLDEVFHNGCPYVASEQFFRLQQRDQAKECYLNFTYQPLYAPGNRVKGILVVALDVTSQVIARHAVEKNEARFRLMTEAMPQLVWATDADGRCTYINQRYESFIGKNSDDLVGTAWRNLIHPDDREPMQQCWDSAMAAGTDYQTEYRLRNQDNTYRWMLSRGVALRDSSGVILHWLGTCTDVEEQRMLVDALNREREVRDRFVAAMTHDLRSPLTAAKMGAEHSLRRASNAETLQAAMQKVVRQIMRADSMIQDLLDANSLRFGEGLPIKTHACDLKEIVCTTVADLADVHGQRVILQVPDAPVRGIWDGPALRRVLENLVNNAVKYGDTTRPIRVTIEPKADLVLLCVHNHGTALSEQEQKTIFDPFKRTDAAKKGLQKGWGLGLPLVRGVAEAHGGAVQVHSVHGAGTTFVVSMPWASPTH